jgi:hypothetical protein
MVPDIRLDANCVVRVDDREEGVLRSIGGQQLHDRVVEHLLDHFRVDRGPFVEGVRVPDQDDRRSVGGRRGASHRGAKDGGGAPGHEIPTGDHPRHVNPHSFRI